MSDIIFQRYGSRDNSCDRPSRCRYGLVELERARPPQADPDVPPDPNAPLHVPVLHPMPAQTFLELIALQIWSLLILATVAISPCAVALMFRNIVWVPGWSPGSATGLSSKLCAARTTHGSCGEAHTEDVVYPERLVACAACSLATITHRGRV